MKVFYQSESLAVITITKQWKIIKVSVTRSLFHLEKSLTFQKIHVIIRDERFTDLPELHDFLNYPCKIHVGQFGDFKGFQL